MTIEFAEVSLTGDREDNQDRAAVVSGEGAPRALRVRDDGPGGSCVTALTDHVSVVFDGVLHRCPDVDAELAGRSAAHLTDAARLAHAYERRGEGILNELVGRYARKK